MKAKLVKRSNGRFDLYSIEDKNQINTIASSFDNPIGKLSIKNCQAIESGYDLDRLVKTEYPIGEVWNDEEALIRELAFKKGFQKALELMGDKKFSEEDMSKAWSEGYHRKVDEINGNELRYFDKFIQSLQKTEWDVEVEMERSKFIADKSLRNDIKNGFNYTPKLDADGCLILKTFKSE